MSDKPHDIELMQQADGELPRAGAPRVTDPKIAAIEELGELVRGHLEAEADHVPEARFAAMWTQIDDKLGAAPAATAEHGPSFWRRVSRWLERYRGHIITGAVSAGAVAALALWLHGGSDRGGDANAPIETMPAAYRPTEIESLETPGGTGAVFHLKDEEGASTVIWVSPEDTVDGI